MRHSPTVSDLTKSRPNWKTSVSATTIHKNMPTLSISLQIPNHNATPSLHNSPLLSVKNWISWVWITRSRHVSRALIPSGTRCRTNTFPLMKSTIFLQFASS